jgi:hypothetical protein
MTLVKTESEDYETPKIWHFAKLLKPALKPLSLKKTSDLFLMQRMIKYK